MNIIIVGAGEIGVALANIVMRRPNNRMTLIEVDERRAEEIAGQLDALVLHGDGTHPEILRKAGIAEAAALVATTGSDAINTVVALLARRMGVAKLVVRVENVGLRAACQEMGVSHVVAPRASAAAEMLGALYDLHQLNFSLVAHGGLSMRQLPAREVGGARVSELDVPEGALIVAVLRGEEEILVPRGSTRLDPGDDLLVLTENDDLVPAVRRALGLEPTP